MPSLFYEQAKRKEGYQLVAGIDEAGRGPLAGPVSAAAVILPDGFYPSVVLDDSKKLTAINGEKLFMRNSRIVMTSSGQRHWGMLRKSIPSIFWVQHTRPWGAQPRRSLHGLIIA